MFFLRQEWRDAEEGVDTVVLHWTTARPGREPNWRLANSTVMLPQPAAAPGGRACLIWVIPPFSRRRLLYTELAEPSETLSFFLYSFCEVIQRGRLWSTETTRQEIRAASVTHSDDSGEYTQAFLYYSFDGAAQVHCFPMWLEGLPLRDQPMASLPEHRPSKREYHMWARREERVARLPLPHLFHGRLWGPANARALYMVYFHRQGVSNPFTEGGFWLLRNGYPWEVQF